MIIDMPQPDDFRHAGESYLSIAWQTVLGLTDIFDWYGGEDDDQIMEAFNEAIQKPLSTAVSLVQQGAEFLLKARIAEVSPYLLIVNSPREWPKGCDKSDKPFSLFKTIDANDLIRVCNSVSPNKVGPEFETRYHQIRALRNIIIHGVDPNLKIKAPEVIEDILMISEELIGESCWLTVRQRMIELEPNSVVTGGDNDHEVLISDSLKAIDLLSPKVLKNYFGFNPKQRRYYCPNCQPIVTEWDLVANTAQLKPNSPQSTTLYCFVCRKTHKVKRVKCKYGDCKGNVYSPDYGACLTCNR